MSQVLQIILDTNILIAAFRSKRGAANLLLDKLDDPRWQVNVSTALLLEYEDVLKRSEMNALFRNRMLRFFSTDSARLPKITKFSFYGGCWQKTPATPLFSNSP
jgi:predicted nucleic acid-binding protein